MKISKERVKFDVEPSQARNFVEFDYFTNKLIIGMKDPSKKEIKEYKEGPIVLKLIVGSKVLFIIFKFGDLNWSDIAYSICTIPEDKRIEYKENINDDYPKEINLMLINVDSNIIKVNRILKLNDKFAKKLRDSVLQQCDNPYSVEECDADIKEIYSQYDPEELSLSKLVDATYSIRGLTNKVYVDVVYEEYGWGTKTRIPNWIYEYIHSSKTNDNKGIIPKKYIPDKLLEKGVVKCKYSSKQSKHLYAALYKQKTKKKTR